MAGRISNNEPIKLPAEIHLSIIEAVGEPPLPSSYALPLERVKDLVSLSLVNSSFRSFTQPILYRQVYLTQRNLHLFATGINSKSEAPNVVSLAIAEFEDVLTPDDVDDIVHIVTGLPDTVKKLLLDMPLRELYYAEEGDTLLKALLTKTSIEEFISVQDEAYMAPWTVGPTLWPGWPKLQRLALYNIDFVEQFAVDAICGMPDLEVLCVLNPRIAWGDNTQESLQPLIKHTHKALKITLLDLENWGDVDTDGDYLPFAKRHPLCPPIVEVAIEHSRFKIVDVDCITSGELMNQAERPISWLLRVARSGRLWELRDHAIPPDTVKAWLEEERSSRDNSSDTAYEGPEHE